ncbi:MAG: hypothetical protein M5R42_02045 [Rhodocyclaceae bacterium]|nr:hypothetical protein [Rhodocyclaceae bacterium]
MPAELMANRTALGNQTRGCCSSTALPCRKAWRGCARSAPGAGAALGQSVGDVPGCSRQYSELLDWDRKIARHRPHRARRRG